MKHVVVTGTGTDVGKTFVTAGLLRCLRRAGVDAVVQKPFQTGCRRRPDGGLDHPDLEAVAALADWRPDPSDAGDLCPYAYVPACSPHLAARLAGDSPSLAAVVGAARRLAERHDVVIAETAGGVLVPVGEQFVTLDWMVALGWPVIVVARPTLGTLNETLLTLRALHSVGLSCAGVVLNDTCASEPVTDDAYIRRDNAAAIPLYGRAPVLATIPYLGDGAAQIDWGRFERAFVSPILTLFDGSHHANPVL